MKILILLVFLSLMLAFGFLWAFVKAVKSGQYDDDYTPSVRMLFDDELVENKKEKINTK